MQDSRMELSLDDAWRIGGGLNGGYLLAVVGADLRRRVPATPDPIVLSAFFLSASVAGPATVSSSLVRGGGRFSTVAAELRQTDRLGADRLRLSVTATYGDLAALPDDVRTQAVEPTLPPPESCLGVEHAPPEMRQMAPLLERFDMRFDPACAGFGVGQPTGRGELRAWFRMADGREPDVLTLLNAVDALPPVSMDLGLVGWAPTLQLTAHVRAHPAPGWLKLRQYTTNVAGGLFEEDCEVWDSSGRLVAQGRQLALLPQ